MPELVLYKGRPVKRRMCGDDKTRLTLFFVNAESGQRSERLNISQAEWRLYGTIEFFPSATMPDVRELARKWQTRVRS